MKNMTISEIAKLAEVSKATVSRVLNSTGYVSEATRNKVKKIIRENSYTPSSTARNLSKQENDTIGVVIPETGNPFFAEILKGISHVVDANNLTLIYCNTDNNAEKDIKALKLLRRQRVRGLIFTPAIDYKSSEYNETIHTLLANIGAPVVILDREFDNLRFDGVYSNNFRGAYMATEALIKAGHRKIGIVTGDLNLSIGRERFDGYKQALYDNNITVHKKYILEGKFDKDISYGKTKEMLNEKVRPTAFFVSNNASSAGFLTAVFEKGLNIPQDIAYIGFDKVDGIEILAQKFSYVERDVLSMGTDAMKLLLKRIDNPSGEKTQIIIQPYLKLMGSEIVVT